MNSPTPTEETAAALAPTAFHTPAYLTAYRRHFGGGRAFHRVRVPGGAAFLATNGYTSKRLEWWGAGIHDIGGATYESPVAAAALWEKITALTGEHDGAVLAQMPATCRLPLMAGAGGWQVTAAETCPVLTLPATYDDYVRSLGKNMREQIKRYPKRLEKQCAVEYQLASTESEVQCALTDLFRLHGKRWRARGQTGVLATPRRQKFHREVCSAFLRHDWLRLWTLRCDGQAVCVLLNYFHGGRYYFFIGGFDPAMLRLSVGTCLFARVFQHAIEEGAHEFDFLKGEEEYKYRYGAVNRAYVDLTWYADTSRGRLLRHRVNLENAFRHQVHRAFSAAHRKPAAAPKEA